MNKNKRFDVADKSRGRDAHNPSLNSQKSERAQALISGKIAVPRVSLGERNEEPRGSVHSVARNGTKSQDHILDDFFVAFDDPRAMHVSSL